METKEKRDRRFPVMLSNREIAAIDEFRWNERIKSQSEALRQLVGKGLEAAQHGGG